MFYRFIIHIDESFLVTPPGLMIGESSLGLEKQLHHIKQFLSVRFKLTKLLLLEPSAVRTVLLGYEQYQCSGMLTAHMSDRKLFVWTHQG